MDNTAANQLKKRLSESNLIPNYHQFELYHPDAVLEHRSIAFIGAGNMTHAIIRGLINSGYPADLITASAPSRENREQLQKKYAIKSTHNNIQAVLNADVIVLAVKPQMITDISSQLLKESLNSKLIISIMAGVTIPRLHELFPSAKHIIRTMPNTPAFIGKGMTGIYAPHNLLISFKIYTQALMETIGEVCWVEDELQMNSVIAAAGSAPAYFFYFMEAMQAVAIAQGLSKEQARQLVQYAAVGAASMVQENSDIEISTLRHNVTSKGGTTEKAISVFNEAQMKQIIAEAMQAAYNRAVEMERLF